MVLAEFIRQQILQITTENINIKYFFKTFHQGYQTDKSLALERGALKPRSAAVLEFKISKVLLIVNWTKSLETGMAPGLSFRPRTISPSAKCSEHIREFLLGVHEASLFTILLKSFEKFLGNLKRITLAVLFLFEVLQSSTAQYRKPGIFNF